MTDLSHIRNFAVIAHIDHGKSTLADRLIQCCGGLTEREMKDQVLDSTERRIDTGLIAPAGFSETPRRPDRYEASPFPYGSTARRVVAVMKNRIPAACDQRLRGGADFRQIHYAKSEEKAKKSFQKAKKTSILPNIGGDPAGLDNDRLMRIFGLRAGVEKEIGTGRTAWRPEH